MSRIRRNLPRRPGPLSALVALLLPAVGLAQSADHLLVSEVVVRTRDVGGLPLGSPFIEVANPTGSDVDLTAVYLSTAHDTQLGQLYWNVAVGENLGGGASGNVHCRFPHGMTLAAGDTLVIAINGSNHFNLAYGRLPDLELFEDGTAPDQVPEMVEVVTGSIGAGLGSTATNTPALSTLADSIVLYRWTGGDLVADLDYLRWGTDVRVRVDKTGVTVGESTYLADTAAGLQIAAGSAPTFGHALRRLDAFESGEEQLGGNGASGHDETSENLAASWDDVATQEPPTAPASWYPPAPIVLSAASGGALEGVPVNVQAQVVAYDAIAAVTIPYRVDGGPWLDLAAAPARGNPFAAQIPGQVVDALVEWYLTATATGGGAADWPVEGTRAPRSYTVGSGGSGDVVKLLFTEVSVLSTAQEYIEIVNPGLSDVDLSDYYLTDAIHAPLSQYYWRIAEGNPTQATVGGGAYTDFHARCPDGFTLAAGDTIVVSIAGSDAFYGAFGYLPSLELFEDGGAPDAIPDLRPVFGTPDGPNSIVGETTPSLTNTAECLILYHWDGVGNLVTDIDVFFWGDNPDTRFCKTGVTIGGETYQDETAVASQQPFLTAVTFGNSYQRTDAAEGAQPGPPGNGVGGRDEVGEDFPNTFAIAAYSPARPELEAPLIRSVYTSPAFSDRTITVRATVDSQDALAAVTLFYALNGGSEETVVMATNGADTWDGVIPQQATGTVIAWRVVARDVEGDEGLWPVDGGTLTLTVTDPPDPSTLAQHLLISEVCARGAEFVEIHNPLDHEVPLGRYFLTDAIYAFGSQYYWRITEGNPSQLTSGGGAYDDFHGRFPDGAVIGAGETITVALAGSDGFAAAYFVPPDYELFEDGAQPDDIPDLVEVFPGSLAGVQEPYGNPPGLSNGGEIVVLYWWNGESALVTDVDVFFWDTEGTNESTRFSKNGVVSGGETYGPELTVAEQQPFLDGRGTGESYTRRDRDEDDESQGGFGNGVDGHDETSEVFMTSFTVTTATPGQFLSGGGEGEQGEVALRVPARTFLPDLETFAIEFATRTDTETRVRILDQEGRLVLSLYDSRFDGPASVVPGVYTTRQWDGRDATYERVRAGLYVVHLQVIDRVTGKETIKTAPVVVATRLK